VPISPQPPEDFTPPKQIPAIFLFGPKLLILGSVSVLGTLCIASEAFRWSDHEMGLTCGAILAIPMMGFIAALQMILAFAFMSKGRWAWWRTLLVTLPALVVGALPLLEITSFFPPERRARRKLEHFLGPLPTSVTDIRMTYQGGIDPSYYFEFNLSPEDWEKICNAPLFQEAHENEKSRPVIQLQVDDMPNFYQIEYDAATRRCHFSYTNV
jgi:hypothetical protein